MMRHDSSVILRSEILDDDLLFSVFGIDRSNIDTFTSLYWNLSAQERPSLSWFFDPLFYLSKNPDVEASGIDPFLHFILWGAAELRDPHPLISMEWVFNDIAESAVRDNPISIFSSKLLGNHGNPSPYFDLDYYSQSYPEALVGSKGVFQHFLSQGMANGFNPNPYFDSNWYTSRYSGVEASSLFPILHFAEIGDRELLIPGPSFDPDWYLNSYPDVRTAGMPPLYHFLAFGKKEGRLPRRMQESGHLPAREGVYLSKATVKFDFVADKTRYSYLKSQVELKAQNRIESVQEVNVLPVKRAGTRTVKGLKFKNHAKPKVSVIIPCFNEFEITLDCLYSVQQAKCDLALELIVVDDASTDPRFSELKRVPGLRYFRNAENLGFLKTVNKAYLASRGQYVLLLNNDTQIFLGTIESLSDVLDGDNDVAAVGPKILFPNGRLQEAGCAVNQDATSIMVGVFDDPSLRIYNWKRPVQYCSGAGLMLRKNDIMGELFDERFAPAYCEDLDLCLRLGARGKKIMYEPKALLVHHLSVSMAKESQEAKIQRIAKNQQKLFEKWQSYLEEISRVRVFAFYLPQFHPTPENDLWWGRGFTEWTNVAKAIPSYAEHYQPHLPADLGFYDLRLPQTFEQQAALAAQYGIEGFAVYYYNFNGRRILSQPLDILLANPDIPFKFCVCWANENWTKRWDGGSEELLLGQSYGDDSITSIAEDLVRYSADKRYLKVNGKPIFLVYRPLLIPDCREFILKIRNAVRAFGEFYFLYVESMETVGKGIVPQELGFDASVEFPPHGVAVPCDDDVSVLKEGWAGVRYDYPKTVVNTSFRHDRSYVRHPGVFPSWDNTPRQPLKGTSFDRACPEAFQVYLENKVAEVKSFATGDERLLFINAWNEWAEGAHLEPDLRYGHAWLDAVRNALRTQLVD